MSYAHAAVSSRSLTWGQYRGHSRSRLAGPAPCAAQPAGEWAPAAVAFTLPRAQQSLGTRVPCWLPSQGGLGAPPSAHSSPASHLHLDQLPVGRTTAGAMRGGDLVAADARPRYRLGEAFLRTRAAQHGALFPALQARGAAVRALRARVQAIGAARQGERDAGGCVQQPHSTTVDSSAAAAAAACCARRQAAPPCAQARGCGHAPTAAHQFVLPLRCCCLQRCCCLPLR